MKRFAEPRHPLDPFGAVRLDLPPCPFFPTGSNSHSLRLKDAKKLHKNLGRAIREYEKGYTKLIRSLTKSSPFKRLLHGRKFSPAPEIRGVK